MVLQSVQTSYKLLRATKPILSIHRGIAPPIEILVNSQLNPTGAMIALTQTEYQQKAEGVEKLKMWSFRR